MMYIKRKLSIQGYHMWKIFFSALDHMTSHDHNFTSHDLFRLSTSRIDSIIITKNIGVLDINWKLKTAVLQWNMSRQVRVEMNHLRLTFIDLCWPQNLSFWNICMFQNDIKRKLNTKGYHMWKPFFSALDYMASDDHDLTSRDLFGPWKLKNFHTYPVLRSPFAKLYCLSAPMSWLQHSKQGCYEFIDQAFNILAISLWFKSTRSPVHTIH